MEQGSTLEAKEGRSNSERWWLSFIYTFTNMVFCCLQSSLLPLKSRYYWDDIAHPPTSSILVLCEIGMAVLLWTSLWIQWIPLKLLAQVIFITFSTGCLAILFWPGLLARWFFTPDLGSFAFRTAVVLVIVLSIWLVSLLQRDISYLHRIKGEQAERQAVSEV